MCLMRKDFIDILVPLYGAKLCENTFKLRRRFDQIDTG